MSAQHITVHGEHVYARIELRGLPVAFRASIDWTEDSACRRVRVARLRDQQPQFDLTSAEHEEVEQALFDAWDSHEQAVADLSANRI